MVEIKERVEIKDCVSASVKRGPDSWNYIYVMLGFVLAIGGTVISMLPFGACNILTYALFAAVAISLFLFNGWFQNKLIALKSAYENKAR
jgi:hypothetical protein